ncbi:hypothetical protein K443DRAFT_682441, partial [Laccaria amethystina LaAM-08-1]
SQTSEAYSDHWPLTICLMKTSIHRNNIKLGTVKLFVNKTQNWMQAPATVKLQHNTYTPTWSCQESKDEYASVTVQNLKQRPARQSQKATSPHYTR